jgi:hypothetical protein
MIHTITTTKLITISPGGYKGFYMMGICTYIKQHYDLSDFIFSGASAGAWNSLYMTYQGEPTKFVEDILDKVSKITSALEIKDTMKHHLLTKYNETDFDLHRLFVSVSKFREFEMKPTIYSQFQTLENAIDCCISSSHIPFLTGNMMNKYQDSYSFDGGFSKHPFPSICIQNKKPVLQITPDIWKTPTKKKTNLFNRITKITDYTTLLSRNKYDLGQLYMEGYMDAKEHADYLDEHLLT